MHSMKTARKLQQEVMELKAAIQLKDTQLKQKTTYIQNLEAALIDLKKYRFGSSSEKQKNKDQLQLFNEVELINDAKTSSKKTNKKKKNHNHETLSKDLPHESKIHDITDEQKYCPNDKTELKHIGEIVTRKLIIKPAVFKVIEHKQYKYACPCCKKHILTAKKPKDIIPKSITTPELLSQISVSKYADAMPLYRLSAMFKRLNVKISRQNMANWMIKCSIAIQPLVNLIQDELYNQPCIHIDESPIQVLKEPGKKAQAKSYMWVQRAGDNIIFNYHPNRSAEIIEKLFENYSGAIMTDGYSAYDKVTNKYSIKHLGCWVHARRYFIKVIEQGQNSSAQKMINLISELYLVEKRIKNEKPDEKYIYRQCNSLPIITKIRQHLDTILHSTAPAGLMGKALNYLHNQWQKLIVYLDDGNYPIDNNAAENAIRPFVIGRKNWLFSNTPSGAQASANMYSIIETAKAHGINPQEYLTHVYKETPLVKSIEDYEKLLPWNFKSDNSS